MREAEPLLCPAPRPRCRACGGETIVVFDMGSFYPNEFPAIGAGPSRPRVPLAWVRCHPCGLIQLSHTTPPEWLFGVDPAYPYWYRSSVNEAMRRALAEVVDAATSRIGPLLSGDVVVDVGANDGTLLSFLPKGVTRFAFEPARNLESALSQHADVIVQDFFPSPKSPLVAGSVRLLFSIAMFYDLDDPAAFCAEVKRLLQPNGVWVMQIAYLPAILKNSAYDGNCHEHLLYLGLIPLLRMLAAAGLQAVDIEEVAVNEGSIRLFITHRDSQVPVEWSGLEKLRELTTAEKVAHLHDTNEPYIAFREAAEENRREARKLMLQASIAGYRVDLLGASTKGNTWLQWCGFGPDAVRRAIERSPEKVGRATVTGIPIVGEEEGRQKDPAEVLICPIWAFREAVIARERGKWPTGTRLVFCLPKVEEVRL